MSKIKNLEIRIADFSDIKGINHLIEKVYGIEWSYKMEVLRGQIRNFKDGCFVIVVDGEIVAYSASIIVKESDALNENHTWAAITGRGYGSTHDPMGDYLYGYETCVDPDIRKTRLGRRIYMARENLAKAWNLKGIVFGGRIPNYRKRSKKVTPEEYVNGVINKTYKDPILGFQIRNGFEVKGIIKDYLPSDKDSMGYAVHLVWENPEFQATTTKSNKPFAQKSVRVVTVQYQQRPVKSFEDFANVIEYYVDVAGDYRADFLLFPELFTMQLLSIKNEEVAADVAIENMTKYTEQIKKMFRDLALRYNVNIIGGSHPTKVDDKVRNISYIFLRDGSIHEQAKIHPTPDEKYWWKIEGGDDVKVIDTDCGPIGVLICYDSEFPELTRRLVDQGMHFLFVPFLTDNRQAFCRVKYSCQARAIENQIYVTIAGNVGNLPKVRNLDIQYAQSCIITPCDFPFARDGIAADTSPNVETVAIADLRVDTLLQARTSGAVRNLADRRHDLYEVVWKK